MTSALLQIIAVVTMLIDHIGYYIPGMPEFFRFIGRIAFPLFCFMFTEGFRHTSSRKKYFVRLLLFAVITHFAIMIIGAMGIKITGLNVLFCFCAAFLVLSCFERGGLFYLLGVAIIVAANFIDIEYGALGILLSLVFYYTQKYVKNNAARFLIYTVSLILLGIAYIAKTGVTMHYYYVLAAPIITLYNGKKGSRLPRYFLYIFYPCHQLLLASIRFWMLR